MSRPIKNLLIIVVVLLLAFAAWKLIFGGHGMGGPQMGPMPVGVAEVIERRVTEWSEFSGRLVAVDQAQVRPQVSGVIDQVLFKDGALVKKGDSLFIIDPRPYQAALSAAEARATFAEAEYKRAQALIAEKALSQREFDQRKSDAMSARAALTQARLNLEYTKVKAPISGRAGRAEVTAGNLVDPAAGILLTTIVASERLYADFDIDEAHFVQYARAGVSGSAGTNGIPVMMALTGESEFTRVGKIDSFDNAVNVSSGTIRVRAVFENPDNALVAGMFARIRLGGASENTVLLITDRAVGTDQNKKFVQVVGEDNKAQRREVTLGDSAEGLRIVTSGLERGEKIIVSGLQRVMMPGQEVKPELIGMTEEMSNDKGQMPKDAGETNAPH